MRRCGEVERELAAQLAAWSARLTPDAEPHEECVHCSARRHRHRVDAAVCLAAAATGATCATLSARAAEELAQPRCVIVRRLAPSLLREHLAHFLVADLARDIQSFRAGRHDHAAPFEYQPVCYGHGLMRLGIGGHLDQHRSTGFHPLSTAKQRCLPVGQRHHHSALPF